jgi:hypothetical protein
MILFMPRHLCKQLGIRVRTYLREAYTLPILITVPMVLVLLLMQRWFIPHHYVELAVQLLIAGMVYGSGLLWVVLTKRALRVGELAPKENQVAAEIGAPEIIETYQP